MELLAKFLMAIGQILQFILTSLSLLYNSAYASINNYLLKNDLPPKEIKYDNTENTQMTTNNLEIQTPNTIQNYPEPKKSNTEGMNESENAKPLSLNRYIMCTVEEGFGEIAFLFKAKWTWNRSQVANVELL